MNVNEVKKELAAHGLEFKNSPVNINPNSPYYYNGRTVRDCYKNCSGAKLRAYDYCLNLCAELNGKNFGVRSYNCMMFTCHFTFTLHGRHFYCVITKAHNYVYPIGEKI